MTLIEDMRALRETMAELQAQVLANKESIARQDEQISGERGMSAALNKLAIEVASLRKAAYWVAGLIVASSIGFAFSVLTIFGQ